MEYDKLTKILEKHFEDDNIRFNKLEELATINGNHLSYFNKNLEEVKGMLGEQNRVNAEHIKRVEPMIAAYERDTAFSKTLGEKGKKWGVRITMVASIIGGWYVIKNFIINLIIK